MGDKNVVPPWLAMWAPNMCLGIIGIYLVVKLAREKPYRILGGITGMLTIGPGDPNASFHGVFAVLVGLYHYRKTGEGQFIELAQIEAMIHIMGEAFAEYAMNGHIMKSNGQKHFFFKNNKNNDLFSLTEGSQHKGWKLMHIIDEGFIFEHENRRYLVNK